MPSYLYPLFKQLYDKRNERSHYTSNPQEVEVERKKVEVDERMIEYDEYLRKEAELEKLITPEFISTLQEACRLYGWGGDYTEIRDFFWFVVGFAHPDVVLDNTVLTPYTYEIPDTGKPAAELTHDELHEEWRRLAVSFIDRKSVRCRNLEAEIARREGRNG